MDLTMTCPTCGHAENKSLETCSFCGVDLGRHSEPRPEAEAVDPTAGDESVYDLQSAADDQDLLAQSSPAGKPASVDEAVAHVMAADPIMDLVEEIESDKGMSPAGNDTQMPAKADPEKHATASSYPDERSDEDAEAIILPESVQLQAEKAAGVSAQSAEKAPSGAPDTKTATEFKKQELKKHRAALAKAEAVKKRKLAIAKAAALKKKKMALQPAPAATVHIRIQKLLKPYLGDTIGINYDNSAVIAAAELTSVNSEYLTVRVQHTHLQYHFPLKTILSVIESTDKKGVPTGVENEVFNAVIKIYPLVLF